jgi:hypothetical protein
MAVCHITALGEPIQQCAILQQQYILYSSVPYYSSRTAYTADQLGGLPGCSVEHYLILMLDFIQRNIDRSHKEPTAVLAGLVDFSKAFNRIDHNVIITILSDLNIPTCALRLFISYLSQRKMCVRYNGAESSEQDIPGGGPQGGLLTVILFGLQVNLAGAPCPILSLLPLGVCFPCFHQWPNSGAE